MKDILVLLVLLNAHTIKVCSLPYRADSDGHCLDPTTEYWLDGPNLCCKKCHPGQKRKQHCSETTETVCEQCPSGQYMEAMNYSPNCFSCNKCKAAKGLLYAQNCSSTTRSKCGCQDGMYCIMGFDGPYCTACSKYRSCKAGYGVSVPGTANSDVKCQQCPNGTFSDTVSHTDRCRPHKNCKGKTVRKGNATSDSECEPEPAATVTQPQSSTKKPHPESASTTASRAKDKVSAASDQKAPPGPTDSTQSISHLPPTSQAAFNNSTKRPPLSAAPNTTLAAVTASVIGIMILLVVIILMIRYKLNLKKAVERFPKVDANGNCESADKINPCYLGEIEQTSFTVTSPEHHCLLETREACADRSLCGNNSKTLFRADGCSSYESIGPLQSTLCSPRSALSEPMTLLSHTEPVSPQPSIPTQTSSSSSSSPSPSPSPLSSSSSSQPISPQIISPVTTSPHVNVNITVHIGNGTAGTPSVMPTDLIQVDSELPFGEEEESFSIPQQEAGKQSLMSVQESESYSA